MIVDVTGVELTPGNNGEDCLGNGTYTGESGEVIECCCDECDYMLCCFTDEWEEKCLVCKRMECPRKEFSHKTK